MNFLGLEFSSEVIQPQLICVYFFVEADLSVSCAEDPCFAYYGLTVTKRSFDIAVRATLLNML